MRILCGVAAVALFGLAGCGKSGGDQQSTTTTTVASTTAPASTPLSAPPPPSPPPACRAGDLTLTKVSSDAGAGQRSGVYGFINTGPEACMLQGYPTVLLFDADGNQTDQVTAVQSPATYGAAGGPPQPVTLAPHARAVFFTSFTGIQATDKPCVAISRLQVTPPGNTQAIDLQDTLSVCTGVFHVSPVRRFTALAGAGTPATSNNPNKSVFY